MQAVIFDMDGVLVDSEPLWRRAERAVFAEVGLDLTDSDCELTMGMRSDEVIGYWYRRAPWTGASVEEVEARLDQRMLMLIAESAEIMPGVEHAISVAAEAGLDLGLASSSSPGLIKAVLAKCGLTESFRVAHSALVEERGKPHPAVFLTAARMLGAEPAQCVAIEDSAAGVRSALAAGLRVIAVPPAHLFDDAGYDDVFAKLRTLEDIEPEMLR